MLMFGILILIIFVVGIIYAMAKEINTIEDEYYYSEEDDDIRKENRKLRKEIRALKRGNRDPMTNPINRGRFRKFLHFFFRFEFFFLIFFKTCFIKLARHFFKSFFTLRSENNFRYFLY